jgi:bisphosphoglycerate-dependent phosphoglycerate mutase
MYGSLQGLNKAETALKCGDNQLRFGEEVMKFAYPMAKF